MIIKEIYIVKRTDLKRFQTYMFKKEYVESHKPEFIDIYYVYVNQNNYYTYLTESVHNLFMEDIEKYENHDFSLLKEKRYEFIKELSKKQYKIINFDRLTKIKKLL